MHGTYLIAKPKLSIQIEGNTDERGSAEYNLALGQKARRSPKPLTTRRRRTHKAAALILPIP